MIAVGYAVVAAANALATSPTVPSVSYTTRRAPRRSGVDDLEVEIGLRPAGGGHRGRGAPARRGDGDVNGGSPKRRCAQSRSAWRKLSSSMNTTVWPAPVRPRGGAARSCTPRGSAPGGIPRRRAATMSARVAGWASAVEARLVAEAGDGADQPAERTAEARRPGRGVVDRRRRAGSEAVDRDVERRLDRRRRPGGLDHRRARAPRRGEPRPLSWRIPARTAAPGAGSAGRTARRRRCARRRSAAAARPRDGPQRKRDPQRPVRRQPPEALGSPRGEAQPRGRLIPVRTWRGPAPAAGAGDEHDGQGAAPLVRAHQARTVGSPATRGCERVVRIIAWLPPQARSLSSVTLYRPQMENR